MTSMRTHATLIIWKLKDHLPASTAPHSPIPGELSSPGNRISASFDGAHEHALEIVEE